MALNTLRYLLERVNPWVESVVLFVILLFLTFIIAKILSNVAKRSLHYFRIKNYDFLPEITEYGTYIVAFVLVLIHVGIFKLAIIIFLSIVVLLIVLSLFTFIQGIIPDIKAGRKLKNKKLNCNYGKKYKLGLLSTTYYISKEEILVISNKELLNKFNRRLS